MYWPSHLECAYSFCCRVPLGHIRAEGKIKNVNTIEDFKNMDKQAMLQTAAKQVSPVIVCSTRFDTILTEADMGCD